MFRCLRPGCPTRCGKHGRLSCREKSVMLVLAVFLALVLVASLRTGVKSLNLHGRSSWDKSESVAAPAGQILELTPYAEDDRGKRGFSYPDRQPELLAYVPVQVSQQGRSSSQHDARIE